MVNHILQEDAVTNQIATSAARDGPSAINLPDALQVDETSPTAEAMEGSQERSAEGGRLGGGPVAQGAAAVTAFHPG